MPTRLTLSIDAAYDWLSCTEFGFVDDGVPVDAWHELIEDRVALVEHPITGAIAGFTVVEWASFDPAEHDALFTAEPRFAAPQLGLTDASVGEICLAARAWLGDEPTLGRAYFHMAMGAPGPDQAIETWLLCLETGELQAHYSLGYTYFETGDFKKAYRHLRAYTELAPWNGWAWCWFGRVCVELGELTDARTALLEALKIEADGGHETDADELLEQLGPRVA